MARWLSPAMDRVPDVTAMSLALQQWITEKYYGLRLQVFRLRPADPDGAPHAR